MTKLPVLNKKHKVCVICEGYEEVAYFKRLLELGVWNSTYEFTPMNAKSASKIPAMFQDVFQNNRYELFHDKTSKSNPKMGAKRQGELSLFC